MAKKPETKTVAAPAPAPAQFDLTSLAKIAAAGALGMFVPAAIGLPLQSAGMIQVDTAKVNDKQEAFCTVTPAGYAALGQTAPAAPTAAAAAAGKFKIFADVDLPEAGSAGRSSKYPFESLEVGHGFFVADDEIDGERSAHEALQSTVATASKRMRPVTFVVRALQDGGKLDPAYAGKAGAFVKRVADLTPAQVAEKEAASARRLAAKSAHTTGIPA